MPSIEAQRTLVKSPPELWAELSDPTSLARHLGDFGEIRIARVEPEQSVEWEADAVRGTVQLKPSGWGTKVTLTVVRDTPELEPAVPELEPAVPELEAGAPEPEAAPIAVPESSELPDPEPAAESEIAALEQGAESRPTTRRSRLFARLFRRRGAHTLESEQPQAVGAEQPELDEPAALDEPAELNEPAALDEPVREQDEPPDLAAELAAELSRVEAVMAEQDAELLGAVLDRLGAAHHRPFSRG